MGLTGGGFRFEVLRRSLVTGVSLVLMICIFPNGSTGISTAFFFFLFKTTIIGGNIRLNITRQKLLWLTISGRIESIQKLRALSHAISSS